MKTLLLSILCFTNNLERFSGQWDELELLDKLGFFDYILESVSSVNVFQSL